MQLGAAVRDFLRFCALERRFSDHTTQDWVERPRASRPALPAGRPGGNGAALGLADCTACSCGKGFAR
jgi:hypothetical protein